jgi:Na+/melibiose symporter-like transporter
VDILGSGLLLLATLAVTAGFEEADSRFPWKSAYVISLLTIGGLLWILFSFWERYVTLAKANREPVLPWRFFSERALVGILL